MFGVNQSMKRIGALLISTRQESIFYVNPGKKNTILVSNRQSNLHQMFQHVIKYSHLALFY